MECGGSGAPRRFWRKGWFAVRQQLVDCFGFEVEEKRCRRSALPPHSIGARTVVFIQHLPSTLAGVPSLGNVLARMLSNIPMNLPRTLLMIASLIGVGVVAGY